MFITDLISHCTAKIECTFPDGKQGSGTGFFMNLCVEDDQHVPVIVTNRHVVYNATSGKFCLTLRKNGKEAPDTGNFMFFELSRFSDRWLYHPTLDLAVMPINPLMEKAKNNSNKFFIAPLMPDLIPSPEELADMPALQEIVMVGYPNGIWDSHNNQPIFRKGITATHPELNYNGKPEFMIDAACFNGSSGSPVFIVDIGKVTSRSSGTTIGPSRVKLLGILYAGPQHIATGEIVTIEIGTKNLAVTSIPNNLGNVIASRALLDFEPHLKHLARTGKKPTRMDICPCNSGRRYKECCGKLT